MVPVKLLTAEYVGEFRRCKVEKHASVWAYLTAGITTLFGGVTLEHVALWVGIGTALGTFFVNWYYKAREDARATRREG